MKTLDLNKKLIIIVVLLVAIFSSFIYLETVKKTVHETYSVYEKTTNEISIIKQLKTHYGDKTTNKRKVNNILDKYNSKIISKKEDKNSIEFTVGNLKYNELDNLNKTILNSGVKINKLSIKRIDLHKAELFCKVIF